jgi:hypothetical protein
MFSERVSTLPHNIQFIYVETRLLPTVIGGPGGRLGFAMMSAASIDDHRERDRRIEIGIKIGAD